MSERSDGELKEGLLDTVFDLSRRKHQQTWWPFVGSSMSPYIKAGDMLLVQHALDSIRLGDVIVFKCAQGLIAHRVVFIRKHGNCQRVYRTRGDNTRSFDTPVTQSSVLGRVVCVQKNDKSISLERPRIRVINFILALLSYAIGILYQTARLTKSKALKTNRPID